jgi:ribosomal protein S18 acetylase RimI-like enzyme
MMELTLSLNLLAPVDWPVLRAARLEALRDSPHAFMSSYNHESGWQEPDWRRMFNAARWIVAREAENVIGLARSVGEPGRSWVRHLESIWVAPTHRQRGVFRALLHALAEMDRRMGVTDLMLWVLEDNHEAQRAYEALGFEPTGERQPLPDFGRFERRLRLDTRELLES